MDLRKELGLPEKIYESIKKDTSKLDKARELVGDKFIDNMKIVGKQERHDSVNNLKNELKDLMLNEFEDMSDEEVFSYIS